MLKVIVRDKNRVIVNPHTNTPERSPIEFLIPDKLKLVMEMELRLKGCTDFQILETTEGISQDFKPQTNTQVSGPMSIDMNLSIGKK